MNGGSSHIYHTLSDAVVLLFVIETTMSVIQYLYLFVTPEFLMQKQHLWIPVFYFQFYKISLLLCSDAVCVVFCQFQPSFDVQFSIGKWMQQLLWLLCGHSCCGCCVDTVVVVAVWTQCHGYCVDRVFVDTDINFVTAGHDRFSLNRGTN